MIWQSRLTERCLVQLLLNLTGDVESNPSPSDVHAMPAHVNIEANRHVSNSNTAPT